jgi:hypothetical protein
MFKVRHKSKLVSLTLALALGCGCYAKASGQLLGEPPIPAKDDHGKKAKRQHGDAEWLWQYSPPPVDGRENDLIRDPHFLPFLSQYLTAPQSFWGPQKDGQRKTLAQTAYDFLAIPGKVIADDNRYITATGSVFHFRSSRGLLFVDLNEAHPLVVFAAIDWIRDSKTTDHPDAEFTLWIFPDSPLSVTNDAGSLPSSLRRSLTRWMTEPLPGLGIVEKITAAILVDTDGTPHQIPVPKELGASL